MTAGTWADKWKTKAGTAAAVAVEKVAAVAERVGVVQQRRKGITRDAEKELARRDDINARGAALRADRAAAFSQLMDAGKVRWIQRRPNWLARRTR